MLLNKWDRFSSIFLLFFFVVDFSDQLGRNSTTEGDEPCQTNMFLCHASQRCIPRSWICDQEDDCPDGEDEKNCGISSHQNRCAKDEYECKTSQNGFQNIPDNPWLAHLSSTGYVHTCIPEKWRCDGEFDCIWKDDEMDCTEKPKCDPKTHFECKGLDSSLPTSCIPIEWVCDRQTDCLDMSDELNCTSTSLEKKFECDNETEFRCSDGLCIYKNWHCDGDNDCMDGSDEHDCSKDSCASAGKFKCKTINFCIPDKWKCDGEPDCPDHSDETNCVQTHPHQEVHCKDHEFQCISRAQCISKFWVCDGDEDCFDGSDERNCSRITCPINERACNDNKNCIKEWQWCDGSEDCQDGSDEEEQCSTTDSPSNQAIEQNFCNSQFEYTCPEEKRCIKYQDFCTNKAYECGIKGLCNTEIKRCTQNGTPNDACIHRKMASNGTLYYCASGYTAENSAGFCKDINECDRPGSCDQICYNLPGSYRCDCHPGYVLVGGKDDSMMHKCRAIGPDPLLLLANRAAIRRFDIVTNKYHPLISKLESAVALDYWHANNTLVWSDVSKEQIMICAGISGVFGDQAMLESINNVCAEGSSNLTVIKENVTTPDGLAVDWVHALLFWTDTGFDNINVYDFNTKKRKVLISEGLDEPRAIAVDPSAGLIFWTDWGFNARIERAGMNGENRMTLVNSNDSVIKWPNGLALDILDKRLYWADAKTKEIRTCDYWGQNVRVVLHSHQYIRHPFSLALFEERLYWTDWDQEGVLSVNKFHGGDIKQLMNGVTGPMTVRVYHQQAQPKHENKCVNHNCDHICLPKALYRKKFSMEEKGMLGVPYSCACENGFRIDFGNRSMCVPLDPIGAVSKAAVETYENVNGSGSFTYMFGFLLCCIILAMAFTYYRRRPRHFSVLHFENPIYRRTVEADLDADLDNVGDNSVGSIAILPVGGRNGQAGTDHQRSMDDYCPSLSCGGSLDSQAKLVLSVHGIGSEQQNGAASVL